MTAAGRRPRPAIAGQLVGGGGTRTPSIGHGELDLHVAQNLATGSLALALARDDVTTTAPLLARIHSSCISSETFGGCDCDCVEQLDAALDASRRTDGGSSST